MITNYCLESKIILTILCNNYNNNHVIIQYDIWYYAFSKHIIPLIIYVQTCIIFNI